MVRQCGGEATRRPRAEDPERLTQTYLEQVTANKPFREVAEFFASIRYLDLVPQLVREPDRSIGRIGDPYGGDFLEQLAATIRRGGGPAPGVDDGGGVGWVEAKGPKPTSVAMRTR